MLKQGTFFSCYLPDGETDEQKGIFGSNEEFKIYVEEMQKNQFDLNLKVDFSSKYVKGNEADYKQKLAFYSFHMVLVD